MRVLNTDNVYAAVVAALNLACYCAYRTLIYRGIVNKDVRIACVKAAAGS